MTFIHKLPSGTVLTLEYQEGKAAKGKRTVSVICDNPRPIKQSVLTEELVLWLPACYQALFPDGWPSYNSFADAVSFSVGMDLSGYIYD